MKVAYIDASNLKFGVAQSGWELDYKKFRSWLRDKFGISACLIFIGLKPELAHVYNRLQKHGYVVMFRPTITNKDGVTKGNVDGELILQITRDFFEQKLDNVVLVSGDGDYHCIVEFLKEKKVPITIVSPNRAYLSFLLRKTNVPLIMLDDFKSKLGSETKKPPDTP
jgi:uncharacterized LabA/DUF88 family protein